MLVNSSASEAVLQIVSHIESSLPPEHTNLTEILATLSNSGIIEESLADHAFSFAPILQTITEILSSKPFSGRATPSLALFLSALVKYQLKLDQRSQIILVDLIIVFLQAFGKKCFSNVADEEGLKIMNESHMKVDGVFKESYRAALSSGNDALVSYYATRIAESPDGLDTGVSLFIWRNFAKFTASDTCSKAIFDLIPLIIKCSVLNLKQFLFKPTDTAFIASLLKCVQVCIRNYRVRFNSESKPALFIASVIDSLSQISSIQISELQSSLSDIYAYLRPLLVEHKGLIGEVSFESNAASELFSALAPSTSVPHDEGGLELEFAANYFTDGLKGVFGINQLLDLLCQLQFVSSLPLFHRVNGVFRLALLSRSPDSLNDVIRYHFPDSEAVSLSTKNLLLLSRFPFSNWRVADKAGFVSTCLSTLLFAWNLLISSESRFNLDLLCLILNAISNIVLEQPDMVRTDNYRAMVNCLPSTIIAVRTGEGSEIIAKGMILQSFLRLLRGLLPLRDDKIYEVLESLIKTVAIDPLLCSDEAWRIVGLLPFLKHARDGDKLHKQVAERFEIIAGRLLSVQEAVNFYSRHLARNSLYQYCKYAHDMTTMNRACLQTEVGNLTLYIRGYNNPWRFGQFSTTTEQQIWAWLMRQEKSKSIPIKYTLALTPLPSHVALSALSHQARSLLASWSNRIDHLQQKRDEDGLKLIIKKLSE